MHSNALAANSEAPTSIARDGAAGSAVGAAIVCGAGSAAGEVKGENGP
jgi:hypothetical protein